MKGKRNLIMGLVGILILGLNFSVKAEDVYEEWVARSGYYWLPYPYTYPFDMKIDSNGFIYITGWNGELMNISNYLTIKYSPGGEPVWVRSYNGPGYRGILNENWPYALALDDSGNVYVTGQSTPDQTNDLGDYLTIKYNSAGDSMWVRRYDGLATSADFSVDRAVDVAVDRDGNVVITGQAEFPGTLADFITIKYSTLGDIIWMSRYWDACCNQYASELQVDDSGYIYVTGISEGYTTIKYSSSGDSVWVRRTDDFGRVAAMKSAEGLGDRIRMPLNALDPFGNVIVGGNSANGIMTVKYTPAGDTAWVRYYTDTANVANSLRDLAVDKNGNVLVTGGSSNDFITVKYSPLGDTLWTRRYDGPASSEDVPFALDVDQAGNTYVTGHSVGNGGSPDYLTIKYSANGEMLWNKRYNGYRNYGDTARFVCVDRNGSVYVTGNSLITHAEQYGFVTDCNTVKYSPCLPSSPKAGDANSDDSLSILDVITTFYYIFGKSIVPLPYPPCDSNLFDCRVYDRICRYDWNGDGQVRLTDCIWAINYVFNKPGGPWNPVPSLGCCPFPQIP